MLTPAQQDDAPRALDMAARCQKSWAEYEDAAGAAAERGRPQA